MIQFDLEILDSPDGVRQIAALMESLASKQDEVKALKDRVKSMMAPTGDPPSDHSPRSYRRSGKTQLDVIADLVADTPLTREEIHAKLVPLGKAPSSVDQLSSILSRAKSKGLLVTTGGKWEPAKGKHQEH